MSDASPRPLLLVVSAPSGAGKTTLCERLLAEFPSMRYSVSCTTRSPRAGEVDGVHYHFLDPASFQRRAEAGDFLEQALVHGNRYGTLREEVLRGLSAGQDVLMDIDVQGAAQIREVLRAAPPDDPLRAGFVDIFIRPPSVEELRRRLSRRAKDAPEVIERRVRQAEAELAEAGAYRHVFVNDDLDRAYGILRDLVIAEHRRQGGGAADASQGTPMECRRFDSAEALTQALADALAEAAGGTDPGPRALMLAGGRTPLAAYGRLAVSPALWKAPPYVFLSDERYVPRAHKDSNHGAIAPLMEGWGIPASRFAPVSTGLPLEAAAAAWHKQLDGWIADGMRFPFGLLGMGADGHTASLFTLDDVRRAESCGRWVVPVAKAEPPDRISLTPAFLHRVERIILAVTGREKRETVNTLLRQPETIPAGVVLGAHPGVELWVDPAACP